MRDAAFVDDIPLSANEESLTLSTFGVKPLSFSSSPTRRHIIDDNESDISLPDIRPLISEGSQSGWTMSRWELFCCTFKGCKRTFTHRYELRYVIYVLRTVSEKFLNTQQENLTKYHDKLVQCSVGDCRERFPGAKDLKRHPHGRHKEFASK